MKLKGRGAAAEEARFDLPKPGRAGSASGLSDRTREALPPVVSPTPDTGGPPRRDEASPAPYTTEEAQEMVARLHAWLRSL